MKKLMFTAAAVAMTTGAFATPLVYDYKASVTHMYDKLVNVRNNTVNPAQTVRVYQKYKKTSSLKGYLIVDDDGRTSQRLNASGATVYDQGRNRAFLVVQNSSAEAKVRFPKLMPAVIEAKRIDTKFKNSAANGAEIQNGIAEGMLFVGGDLMAYNNRQGVATATSILPADNIQGGVRPKLDARALFNADTTVMPAMYSDYAWTSCYLFGEYNGPQWSGLWPAAQVAIDAKQRIPTGLAFGLSVPFYHDTWLNHAGIGTYNQLNGVDGEICCGLSLGDQAGAFVLDQLAGNFKGGIFLCSEDGYVQATGVYNSFLGAWWEDQFWAPGAATGAAPAWTTAGDYDQADVWTDGDIEVNTTDVAYGSWSIKRVTNLTGFGVALTAAEISYLINGPAGAVPANGYAASNLDELNGLIKGAALKLNRNVRLTNAAFANGEIYRMTVAQRFQVPFYSPLFAQAYGLCNTYIANP